MFCHAGSYTPPTASGASYVYYDKAGGRWEDTGSGTHAASDFHHNGDLENYNDPFCINLGKIYGALDDLRTESPRVQVLLPPSPPPERAMCFYPSSTRRANPCFCPPMPPPPAHKPTPPPTLPPSPGPPTLRFAPRRSTSRRPRR